MKAELSKLAAHCLEEWRKLPTQEERDETLRLLREARYKILASPSAGEKEARLAEAVQRASFLLATLIHDDDEAMVNGQMMGEAG